MKNLQVVAKYSKYSEPENHHLSALETFSFYTIWYIVLVLMVPRPQEHNSS